MNKKVKILENVEITGYAAGGKSVARPEGKVLFVEGAVPGDIADVQVTKNKKDWAEGKAIRITKPSKDRVEPFCIHYGVCGGSKWQVLTYEKQLQYKEQEARDIFKRMAHLGDTPVLPIIGSEKTRHYRNKLEFTFSHKRYLTPDEMDMDPIPEAGNALGYHVPRLFDKVLDITECWLMDDINNRIRNEVRDFALKNDMSFYHIREHTGWLRNLTIRYATTGECMVNIALGYEDKEAWNKLAEHLLRQLPEINTLLYTINPKLNDSIHDLEPVVHSGKGYILEKLGNYSFKISPKSFFQTNTAQAERLYDVVKDFAALTGSETVYDLYCGTGSIGIYLSDKAGKVIGVDVTEQAIEDARENATLNGLTEASFFAGDVLKVCNDDFFNQHGNPDVIIVDPPRAGLHQKLVQKLLDIRAPRIVYVSCNMGTQARDVQLLEEAYHIEKFQPVDMFPQTHHIECVALLTRKENEIEVKNIQE